MTSELLDLCYQPLRRIDMTIAIEDITRTEQLDHEELSSVRGGIALIPVDSPPGDGSSPPFPPFPSGFPFNGSSPLDPGPGALDPAFSPLAGKQTTQPIWIDLKNPTAQ
jgi:hypothetical protein